MKLSYLIILFFASILTVSRASAQANASINLLTQNGGVVNQGGSTFLEVTINSTGPATPVSTFRVRAQISVPSAIVTVAPNAQQTGLPSGWTVAANTGGAITVCNATDAIPVGESRTILIRILGNNIGGPSTISGSLTFGNGTANGCNLITGNGTLTGDNPGDNTSTSSIEVQPIVAPVTLTDFRARLVNCKPVLLWATETEINSDQFEIERSYTNNSDWTTIGVVAANGNSTTRIEYSFADQNVNSSFANVFYRLKMRDKDGSYEYSKVLRVLSNCNTVQVVVYPTPVQNGKLYISLTGAGGNTEASLMSISGQVILRNKIQNGTNFLDVSKMANGTYILNVKDAEGIDRRFKILIEN